MSYDGSLKFDTKIDSSGFKSGISKLGSLAATGLKATGAILGGAATAIAGIGMAAIKAGSEFEAGMSEVQAISGASASDMEKLSAKAKEMGAKTKFSASESAEAFKYMAMAGWKTGDMLDGIEGIMNLAAASGEDLATTSDIVTDALTAFGLQASDSGHFADILAAASSNANTNVGMLGESFKYVAPVAGALGYSAEDTSVALGLMANSGIKASQAGTSLRAIMTRLVKPTESSARAIDALGLSITKSDGTMKSWDEVMGDLRQSFGGLTEAEKAEMAALLAGQEAMSGLLAIVNSSDKDFEKLKNSIYNCEGAAKDMADTMNDNLQGQITLLKSALEGLGISLYEEMQEPLKDIVKEANKMVGELQEAFNSGGLDAMVKKAGDIFAQIVVKAAEAGPKLIETAAALVHSFCESLRMHRTLVGKAGGELIAALVKAFLECAGDIWETVAFLVADIAVYLSNHADEIGQAAVKMVEKILYAFIVNLPKFAAAAAKIAVTVAKALIDNLPEIIASVKAGLKEVLWVITEESSELFSGKIASFIKGFVEGFMSVAGPVLSGLAKALKTLFDVLASLPPETLEALGKALGVVAAGIIGIKIKNKLSSDVSKFSGSMKELGGEVKGLASFLPGAVTKIISALGSFKGLAGTVGRALASLGRLIGPAIMSALSSLAGMIGPALSAVGAAIMKAVGAAVTALGGWVVALIVAAIAAIIAVICNWDAVKEFFTKTVPDWWNNTAMPVFRKIGDALAGFFTETIPAVASKIAEGFAKIAQQFVQFCLGVVVIVSKWINDMAQKAAELGAAFIDKIVGFFSGLPEKIGGFFSAAIAKAGEWISGMAAKAAEFGAGFIDKIVGLFTDLPYKIGYFLGNVIGAVASWITEMAAKALEFGVSFIGRILEFYMSLPEKIWGFLVSVVEKTAEWVAQMIQKAAEAGTGFFEKIAGFFAELPYKAGYFLGTVIGTVTSWIADMAAKALEFSASFIGKIVEFFSQLPGKVWEFLTSVVGKVTQWIPQMAEKAAEAGKKFLENVVEFFKKVPGKVWDFLSDAFNRTAKWAAQTIEKAAEAASGFLGAVVKFLSQLPGKAWEFFSGAIEKAVQWGSEMAARAAKAGADFLGKIAEFFSQLPGRIWDLLSGAFEKAAQWGLQMAAKAAETGRAFLENVVGFFVELPERICEFLTKVVKDVAKWAGQLWEKGSSAAKSLVKAVLDGVKALPGQMLDIGVAIVQGVWKGMCSAKNAFVRNVKDFFKGTVDGVRNSQKIHSPSKLWADEVGRWMPPGVGEGFKKAMPALERQMDAELSALAERMQTAVAIEAGGFTVKSAQQAQHEAWKAYPKGGDTYVEEKIEQTNHYHVPVATPSEVSKANRAAARKLLGGVT